MTNNLIMVYLTSDSVYQAKEISKKLMQKKLCVCVNIFPDIQPIFFWPPKTGRVDESHEVVAIVKTLESKYEELEQELNKIHPQDAPCIISIKPIELAKNTINGLSVN